VGVYGDLTIREQHLQKAQCAREKVNARRSSEVLKKVDQDYLGEKRLVPHQKGAQRPDPKGKGSKKERLLQSQ